MPTLTRDPMLHQRGVLLGYGELWVDACVQEVELARVIVAPVQRGYGLGVTLMRGLLEQARHLGFAQAFLRVVPENRVAIACYARAGFAPVSTADQQAFNRGQPIEYLWMKSVLR